MKIKLLGLLAGALLLAAQASNATNLTPGDGYYLGLVEYGIPSGDQDREDYVNHLIDMGLGTTDSALGQDFTRSSNDFGTLPDATWAKNGSPAADVSKGVGSTSIDLGTGYRYLFAKYDGPNWGSYVWYVYGLTNVTIDNYATKYRLSGWTLFNGEACQPGDPSCCLPGDPSCNQTVPEPGSLALLGMGLLGLGLARRRKNA